MTENLVTSTAETAIWRRIHGGGVAVFGKLVG